MRYAEWRNVLCFGWYRACIGLFKDTARVGHGNGLRGAGYLTGMYGVIHEAVPAVEQARLFYSLIHEGDELPPALDVERPKVTRSMVETFVDEWERLGGPQLAMYTSGQSWNKIVGGGERWSKYFLWCAAYPFDTPPQPDGSDVQPMDANSVRLRSTPPIDRNPPLPLPWKKWDVHQHSGHGSLSGYGGFLDLNVYNGTEVELRNRFSANLDDAVLAEKISSHAKSIIDLLEN